MEFRIRKECIPYLNVNSSTIQYKARNFRWGCNGKHIQEIPWTTTIARLKKMRISQRCSLAPSVAFPPSRPSSTLSALLHWSTPFRSLTAYFICPKTKRGGYVIAVAVNYLTPLQNLQSLTLISVTSFFKWPNSSPDETKKLSNNNFLLLHRYRFDYVGYGVATLHDWNAVEGLGTIQKGKGWCERTRKRRIIHFTGLSRERSLYWYL